MFNSPPELEFETVEPVLLRHYIAGARQKRPTVPPEVSSYVVESYVRLRKQSKEEEEQKKSHSYTSARTLLGVLRLSQALARLRYADEVEQGDVDEALRLMEVSKESLYDDEDRERLVNSLLTVVSHGDVVIEGCRDHTRPIPTDRPPRRISKIPLHHPGSRIPPSPSLQTHYRIAFQEVGKPLRDETSLGDIFKAIVDVCAGK